jgi:uncharacterized membrane protein YgcG
MFSKLPTMSSKLLSASLYAYPALVVLTAWVYVYAGMNIEWTDLVALCLPLFVVFVVKRAEDGMRAREFAAALIGKEEPDDPMDALNSSVWAQRLRAQMVKQPGFMHAVQGVVQAYNIHGAGGSGGQVGAGYGVGPGGHAGGGGSAYIGPDGRPVVVTAHGSVPTP